MKAVHVKASWLDLMKRYKLMRRWRVCESEPGMIESNILNGVYEISSGYFQICLFE